MYPSSFLRLSAAALVSSSFLALYLPNNTALAQKTDESQWKLRQAHVIFRHGARTPVFPLPGTENITFKLCANINTPAGFSSDIPPMNTSIHFVQMHITELDGVSPRPYSTVDAHHGQIALKGGECREGQLTELGAIQASKLGRSLRKRYKDIIDLNVENIEARSTNTGRCFASLSAVLGGILHEENEHVDQLRKKEHHKIVHVKTVPNDKEYLIPNRRICEKVRTVFLNGRRNIDLNIEHANTKEKIEALKQKLSKVLLPEAYEVTNIGKNNFVRINDWCMVLGEHLDSLDYNEIKKTNLDKLLEDKELLEDIRKLAAKELAQLFGCQITPDGGYTWNTKVLETLRFGIGFFFSELTNKLNFLSEEAGKVLSLYATHDTTMIPLAIALDIFQMDWPEYCSSITLELWERSSAASVSEASIEAQKMSDTEIVESMTDLETGLDKHPSPVMTSSGDFYVRILWNGNVQKVMTLRQFNAKYSPLYIDQARLSEKCNEISEEEKVANAADTNHPIWPSR